MIANQKCKIIYQFTVLTAVILFIIIMVVGIITTFSNNNAIITRTNACRKAGEDIINAKGTAVEAAIAILACECVASPGKTGFGGGFVALIYNQKTKAVHSLIATETAILNADQANFNNPMHAVGVPGLVKGMWEMYSHFDSTMKWKTLMYGAYNLAKKYANNDEELLRENPEYKHLILSKQLFKTVETIMDKPNDLYVGNLSKTFMKDLENMGLQEILEQDMSNYKAKWKKPFYTNFRNDRRIYTSPSPTAGILTMSNVKLKESVMGDDSSIFKKYANKLFRFMEVFKVVLAQWKFLGDSDFVLDSKKLYDYMQGRPFIRKMKNVMYTYRNSEQEFDESQKNNRYMKMDEVKDTLNKCQDKKFSFSNYLKRSRISLCDFIHYPHHDSMDIMVYTSNSDSVIISTSLTSTFGVKLVSNMTGIILNDHSRLFRKNETSPNVMKEEKRPLNYYTPIIITDKKTGSPILMLSVAGGGLNNIQVASQIIFNFYLDNDFRRIPTVAHIANEIRHVYAYHQISVDSKIISENPTILAETDFLKKSMMKYINDSDTLFPQSYTFQKGHSPNFSFVSMIVLDDIPNPDPYSDARTEGVYKWISNVKFLNIFNF